MTDTDHTLAITQQAHPTGTIVLSVTGELDHYTGPRLDQLLSEISYGPRTGVVLDVSGLEYCDSTGLTLFITAHHRAEAAGASFSVAAPSEDLARIFEITGLDQFLTVHADREQAIDALRT